jgi:selenocysteine lyase/cysteine desulfurase
VLGTIEYLEWLGKTFGADYEAKYAERYDGLRLRLKQALAAIRAYEFELSRALLDVLEETPGVTVHGIKDARRLEERVPTFAFTLKGVHPRQVAELLALENIYAWDGNYYALAVTERLNLEESGGMVRVGPVHYNTVEEIDRFRETLGKIVQAI